MSAAVPPHRDGNHPAFYSARQRVVVLTFDTVDDAEQWDAEQGAERILEGGEA